MKTFFCVDEYINQIRVKSEEQALRMIFGKQMYPHRFDTKEAAIGFMIGRANKKVKSCKRAFSKAQTELTNLKKKYL